jgi:hypothetical protein
MFARFCDVNKQLLRELTEDQVQHLLTIMSLLRHTAAQLNASDSIGSPPNPGQSLVGLDSVPG